MVRGEIYFMDLAPRSGKEQKGTRPCVIVSHDAFSSNPHWGSVTVVPFTSAERWRVPSPTTVLLERGECGMPKACAALAHQVTTLDKTKILGPRLGRLTPGKLDELDRALRNYLVL